MNLNRKHSKQIQSSSSTTKKTLDVQHKHQIDLLQDRQVRIKTLQQDIVAIDAKIVVQEQLLLSLDVDDERRDNAINVLIALKDQRMELRDRVKSVKDAGSQNDYFTKTADILYQYYDIFDNGNDTHTEPVPVPSTASSVSILKYFMPHKATEEETPSFPLPPVQKSDMSKKNKSELLDKFLECTEQNYVKHINATAKNQCSHCGSENVSIISHDGYMWCMECNSIEYVVVDHDKPSYKDPPKEVSYFAYKRINHLQEWLSQVQGKETTEIPEEIYDKILYEIKKQRISNMADLTQAKIRAILKKLKANKYYEHTAHILQRLNGMPAMHMSPELEEKVRTMFKQIQTPFLKHAPPNRKNFLSYSYVLHKLMQLLDRDDLVPMFKTLKSRQKTYVMDLTWKKICEELNWPFIRTI